MTWPDLLPVPGLAPVGCDLDVQSHLDVEQVLVFPQMLGHLALQVPQLGVQLANGVLLHQIRPFFRLLLPSQHVLNLRRVRLSASVAVDQRISPSFPLGSSTFRGLSRLSLKKPVKARWPSGVRFSSYEVNLISRQTP